MGKEKKVHHQISFQIFQPMDHEQRNINPSRKNIKWLNKHNVLIKQCFQENDSVEK